MNVQVQPRRPDAWQKRWTFVGKDRRGRAWYQLEILPTPPQKKNGATVDP